MRPAQLDAEQTDLYREITTGPRASGPQHFALTGEHGELQGPFNALLLAPTLGRALQGVGAAVRYSTSLTPRMRELAILVVAAHWDCAFERDAHESVGRSVGLTDDEFAPIRAGRMPPLEDPLERAGLILVRAMLAGDIDDETWAEHAEHAEHVGPVTVFELSTLVGYYATLALQLRIFRIDET